MRLLKIVFTLVLLGSRILAAGSTELSSEIIKIMEQAHQQKVSQLVVNRLAKLVASFVKDSGRYLEIDANIQIIEEKYSSSEIRDMVAKIKADELLKGYLKQESQDDYRGKPVLLSNRVTYLLNGGQDKTFTVDYVSALRAKLNLVGVYVATGGTTIALRQIGTNRFQFVEIITKGFGRAQEMYPVTEEFSGEQLPDIANHAKHIFQKATVENIIPGGNISAWLYFGIMAGNVSKGQAIPAMAVAAIFDIISAPIQLGMWGNAKIKSMQTHSDLANRVALESNNIVRISVDQYNQVKTALFTVFPLDQTHGMCARFYR